MATPLSVCNQIKAMFKVRFLWLEGVSGAAFHQKLSTQYENSILLQWSVYKWTEKFRNGCTSVINEEGAGRPPMAANEDNVEHASDMDLSDRQMTTDEVAYRLQINHGPAYEIIHNRLAFHKDCT
jgi:hypothetical protein